MSVTRIRNCIAVRCPVQKLDRRLEEYFERRRDADGLVRIPLRIPLSRVTGLKGLALEHDVAVTARRERDDQNLNDLIRIAWSPVGGGPYPSFEGTLVTWSEDEPNQSFIELDGNYAPPLGTAGEAFDQTIGHALALQAARVLLRDLARAVADEPAPAKS